MAAGRAACGVEGGGGDVVGGGAWEPVGQLNKFVLVLVCPVAVVRRLRLSLDVLAIYLFKPKTLFSLSFAMLANLHN